MPKLGLKSDLLKCSFCSKTKQQVVRLIAGPDVYICNECIDLCNEIIVEEAGEVRPVAALTTTRSKPRSGMSPPR